MIVSGSLSETEKSKSAFLVKMVCLKAASDMITFSIGWLLSKSESSEFDCKYV